MQCKISQVLSMRVEINTNIYHTQDRLGMWETQYSCYTTSENGAHSTPLKKTKIKEKKKKPNPKLVEGNK